ncbi:MAG: SDR family oxidoreductase [Bacteroidota bacterium]
MTFQGKVVWITGASSGIGEALVKACVQAGATVLLSARREKELERVKASCGENAEKCFVVPMDLTQIDRLPEIVSQQIQQHGRIDVLVNNGGISQRGLVHETDLAVDRRIMEVNYFGQVALTKQILPHMIQQGSGHIAVISSLTGKFGFPLRSAYAASKHALHGFFETLMLELKPKGIHVTLVNPGRIHTQISVNALTKDGSTYGEMDPGQAKGMSAERCADSILTAIRRKKPEINIGFPETIMVYLKRYAPWLFRRIAMNVSAR